MVGMVVATGMHHQRMAFDFGDFLQARREDRIVGGAIGIDVQSRQVAQMTVGVWPQVLAGLGRIEVTASGQRGDFHTILGACIAAAVFMNMKTMNACR